LRAVLYDALPTPHPPALDPRHPTPSFLLRPPIPPPARARAEFVSHLYKRNARPSSPPIYVVTRLTPSLSIRFFSHSLPLHIISLAPPSFPVLTNTSSTNPCAAFVCPNAHAHVHCAHAALALPCARYPLVPHARGQGAAFDSTPAFFFPPPRPPPPPAVCRHCSLFWPAAGR
jgi:hypothetical protein